MSATNAELTARLAQYGTIMWAGREYTTAASLPSDEEIATYDARFNSAGVADGSITAAKLASGAVTAATIATGAVGSDEVDAGAIGTSEITTDGVGSAEIAADAVGSSEIAEGAVGSAELAADSVEASEIAAGAVGASELASTGITPGSYTNVDITVDADGRITAIANGSGGGGAAFSGAKVYTASNYSAANENYSTPIPFDSERYDTDAYHSTSSNTGRLTAPSTGYYAFGFSGDYEYHAGGLRMLFVTKNGTTQMAIDRRSAMTLNSQQTNCCGASQCYLTSGDYLELFFYQTSGDVLDLEANGERSLSFWIQKIG